MERAIEIYALINFIIIGASHLCQPKVWITFFKKVREYGHVGVFANGFLSLIFGSIIVSFHWIWEGFWPSTITCMGIAQVIKSFVAFVFPAQSLKNMSRPIAENPNGFRLAGGLFLILGVIGAVSNFIL